MIGVRKLSKLLSEREQENRRSYAERNKRSVERLMNEGGSTFVADEQAQRQQFNREMRDALGYEYESQQWGGDGWSCWG